MKRARVSFGHTHCPPEYRPNRNGELKFYEICARQWSGIIIICSTFSYVFRIGSFLVVVCKFGHLSYLSHISIHRCFVRCDRIHNWNEEKEVIIRSNQEWYWSIADSREDRNLNTGIWSMESEKPGCKSIRFFYLALQMNVHNSMWYMRNR